MNTLWCFPFPRGRNACIVSIVWTAFSQVKCKCVHSYYRITDLHLCEGIQICIPRWKSTILYTLIEDYKFVHLHRGLQICTPLQGNTNLHTKVESTDFVHPYRGLQICIPSQRITKLICTPSQGITNLYTFAKDYKLFCVPWCLHTRSFTGVHWITAMEYHCNHYWGHLRLTTLLQCIVITIQEKQWLGTALKFLTRISKYHGWRALIQQSSWKPWKIRDPQNHHKTIQWTDHVPKDSIIPFNFALISTNHLWKATIC